MHLVFWEFFLCCLVIFFACGFLFLLLRSSIYCRVEVAFGEGYQPIGLVGLILGGSLIADDTAAVRAQCRTKGFDIFFSATEISNKYSVKFVPMLVSKCRCDQNVVCWLDRADHDEVMGGENVGWKGKLELYMVSKLRMCWCLQISDLAFIVISRR